MVGVESGTSGADLNASGRTQIKRHSGAALHGHATELCGLWILEDTLPTTPGTSRSGDV